MGEGGVRGRIAPSAASEPFRHAADRPRRIWSEETMPDGSLGLKTEGSTSNQQGAQMISGTSRKVAAVLVGCAMVVVGTDVATYAATGQSLILGKINKAGGPPA